MWSSLPFMPSKRSLASALHLKCDRDAIVVVGGVKNAEFDPASTSRSAFLLVHTARSGGEPVTVAEAYPHV